ncbi:MAG: VWA domain-containing protein [Betaproteobacteria bacterium]|nr:VWA domain-containing protein [Betaproteobacteria bacterium]
MIRPVARFARVLRRAGLPVGTDRVLDALRALSMCGIARRDDVYWAFASLFVARREHFEVFDQAFDAFWRARDVAGAATGASSGLPSATADESLLNRRVMEAVAEELGEGETAPPVVREQTELVLAPSSNEALRTRDFASMSVQEMAEVQRLMARLRLPIPPVRTRRREANVHGGSVDTRATFRRAVRGTRELILLQHCRPRMRHAPLVVLCDISGSMQRYTRMFLHFLHAITNDRDRVQVFLFGTRLTNVTRQLRHRDVDAALAAVTRAVADWSGGTRIRASLAEFNLRWSRRVLGQNAAVLLITDGLDRDEPDTLGEEAERLGKSCRRLIWLNPLLRFPEFEARAAGIRAILPHVDHFLPAHNVESLTSVAGVLSSGVVARERHHTRSSIRWK